MIFLRERGSPDVVPALLTSMRFSRGRQGRIAEVMDELAGQKFGTDWFEWMLWQERKPADHPPSVTDPFQA